MVLDEHAVIVFDSVQRPAPLLSDLQNLARSAAAVDAHEKDIALTGSRVDAYWFSTFILDRQVRIVGLDRDVASDHAAHLDLRLHMHAPVGKDYTLKFGEKRPACYDLAKEIIVEAKAGSFRLAFNVPHGAVDLQAATCLTADITLADADAGILESIDNWHKNMPSVPVTLKMLLRNGTTMDLVDNINVIRASCSCCKWCGWRTVHEYDAPFAGCYAIMQDKETAAVVPNEKLLDVTSINGSLHAQFKWDAEGRMFMGNGFAPVTDLLRGYMQKARDMK